MHKGATRDQALAIITTCARRTVGWILFGLFLAYINVYTGWF